MYPEVLTSCTLSGRGTIKHEDHAQRLGVMSGTRKPDVWSHLDAWPARDPVRPYVSRGDAAPSHRPVSPRCLKLIQKAMEDASLRPQAPPGDKFRPFWGSGTRAQKFVLIAYGLHALCHVV